MVLCAGDNGFGQLGNGSTEPMSAEPVLVSQTFAQVAAGYQHTCGVRDNGNLHCWGLNANGQVDTGGVAWLTTPERVTEVNGAALVAAGVAHTCALLETGAAKCFGSNAEGQLGDGTNLSRFGQVVDVVHIGPFIGRSAAVNHTCGLREGGEVICWGEGYGVEAVVVVLPDAAVAITSGSYHACAVLADGTIWCWGWNAYGQLGNGETQTPQPAVGVKADICGS